MPVVVASVEAVARASPEHLLLCFQIVVAYAIEILRSGAMFAFVSMAVSASDFCLALRALSRTEQLINDDDGYNYRLPVVGGIG